MKNKKFSIFVIVGLLVITILSLNLKYNFIQINLFSASLWSYYSTKTTTTPTLTQKDIIAPKVNSFDVQPRTIVAGNQITASFTVTDSGGSYLKNVNLNRAPYVASYCNETNQSRCVWNAVASSIAPANLNSWSST